MSKQLTELSRYASFSTVIDMKYSLTAKYEPCVTHTLPLRREGCNLSSEPAQRVSPITHRVVGSDVSCFPLPSLRGNLKLQVG